MQRMLVPLSNKYQHGLQRLTRGAACCLQYLYTNSKLRICFFLIRLTMREASAGELVPFVIEVVPQLADSLFRPSAHAMGAT